jgi:hypothetical protein
MRFIYLLILASLAVSRLHAEDPPTEVLILGDWYSQALSVKLSFNPDRTFTTTSSNSPPLTGRWSLRDHGLSLFINHGKTTIHSVITNGLTSELPNCLCLTSEGTEVFYKRCNPPEKPEADPGAAAPR